MASPQGKWKTGYVTTVDISSHGKAAALHALKKEVGSLVKRRGWESKPRTGISQVGPNRKG